MAPVSVTNAHVKKKLKCLDTNPTQFALHNLDSNTYFKQYVLNIVQKKYKIILVKRRCIIKNIGLKPYNLFIKVNMGSI